MNRIIKITYLFLIPLLISLSWILGGQLVLKSPPLELSIGRYAVGALILFFFSDIISFIKNNSVTHIFRWLMIQLSLAITGRALYAYLSAKSLMSISPFEAVLISTSLPVFLLIIERLLGQKFKSKLTPLFGVLSFFCIFFAIYLSSGSRFSTSHFSKGHVEMIAAMLFYAIHLIFYKKQVKENSPANPLFIQFLFAVILLEPFNTAGFNSFSSYESLDWIRFFIYAVVCNLLPFILVHYCLKYFSSFTVGAVAILSPIFSFLFKGLYGTSNLSFPFIVLGCLASIFTYLTVRADQGLMSKTNTKVTTGRT